MIMKILAWVFAILILVGLPLLLDEPGLALAGCVIVGYAFWGSWRLRAET